MKRISGILVLTQLIISSAAMAKLKIMPLGDSITEGQSTAPGSYRTELVPMILKMQPTVEFVGSHEQGPPALTQKQHEGHSGWRIDELNWGRYWDNSYEEGISLWLNREHPTIILLMIGTNDIVQNYQTDLAASRLENLLQRLWQLSPKSMVLLSSLIPTNNEKLNEDIRSYNFKIRLIEERLEKNGRPIKWVDMFNQAKMDFAQGDYADGVHPSAEGYRKLAKVWFAQLLPVLFSGPKSALTIR